MFKLWFIWWRLVLKFYLPLEIWAGPGNWWCSFPAASSWDRSASSTHQVLSLLWDCSPGLPTRCSWRPSLWSPSSGWSASLGSLAANCLEFYFKYKKDNFFNINVNQWNNKLVESFHFLHENGVHALLVHDWVFLQSDFQIEVLGKFAEDVFSDVVQNVVCFVWTSAALIKNSS